MFCNRLTDYSCELLIVYKPKSLRRFLGNTVPRIVLAVNAPLASTGGIPIAGKVLVPQRNRFFIGVSFPGKSPLASDDAGPSLPFVAF